MEIVLVREVPADPRVVWTALGEECAGLTSWWQPQVALRMREDAPFDRVGAVVDIQANLGSAVGGRFSVMQFAARIARSDPCRLLVADIVEGHAHGQLRWQLDASQATGTTTVSLAWDRPSSGIRAVTSGAALAVLELLTHIEVDPPEWFRYLAEAGLTGLQRSLTPS